MSYSAITAINATWIPGPVLERNAQGGVLRRGPQELAPPLLTSDEAIRLLRLDEEQGTHEAMQQRLRRLLDAPGEDAARLHPVRGLSQQNRFALAEVLRLIEQRQEIA